MHSARQVRHTSGSCYFVRPLVMEKTTLLADTVKHFSIPCCWYFLDQADSNKYLFLETLLSSIRRCFPSFGQDLDPLLMRARETGNEEDYHRLVTTFIDEVSREIAAPCVIALCNYHAVNESKEIHALVNTLLQRLPEQCVMAIESRSLPHLELAPLIARHQLFGLGSNGLYFTSQDLQQFAQQQGLALSKEESETLTHSFDGWITGILLGSRLGHVQPLHTNVSTSSGWGLPANYTYTDRHQLLTFVMNEVFHDEAQTYAFLKETSILEQLTPARCDALLHTSDAATHLDHAEQQGLFVMRKENAQELTYLCHPSLRKILVESLREREQELYYALQRRAAVYFYREGVYEQALRHTLESRDKDLAKQIMLEVAPEMLQQGRSEEVRHWLAMLPAQMIQKCPRLLLLQVNVQLVRGEYGKAQSMLNEIEVLLHASERQEVCEAEKNVLLAEVALAQSTLFLYQGDHRQAQELCSHILTVLPPEEQLLRIRVHQRLGICLILGAGQVKEGITQLQQALQLCDSHVHDRQVVILHHQLANAYDWSGNYAISEHHRQRALAIWERLGQPADIINNLTGMGYLKAYQGCIEDAESYFHKALTLSREQQSSRSGEAYASLGLGELYLNQKNIKKALFYLEDGLALARSLQDHYLLNCLLCTLALTYLEAEDTHTALSLLNQTSLEERGTRSYESILYHLVKGSILLTQQQYNEAQAVLEQGVHDAQATGIQRLHFRLLLRLAVCLLRQNQRTQVSSHVQKAVALNRRGEHDYALHLEAQAYPCLQELAFSRNEQVTETAPTQVQTPPPVPVAQSPAPFIDVAATSPVRLRIFALGEPRVEIDGTLITRWRMARAMELFFLLLEKSRPIRKEQIIEALWPDESDHADHDQTFRSTVYYLRKALGEACVVQQAGLYRLDLKALYSESIWSDARTFETHFHDGKAALAQQNDKSAAQAFQKMLALYQGDYLQSFYGDWCMLRRDKLRQMCMYAHHQLALIAWRQEQWNECLTHWQHLLSIDSCLEAAHYGAMCCYIRLGNRTMALRQYQQCCQELREQLMIVPGPSLQKLHQRLLHKEEQINLGPLSPMSSDRAVAVLESETE